MKSSGHPSLLRLCVLTVMFLSYTDTYVFAKPRGEQVAGGTASFTQEGNLTVVTASNGSIINYQSFDIGKNETVQFIQPGANATVLNRVLTPDPTNIFGHLEANGIVIISNPYGVFFQNGSVVNTGGLIAGAGKISDADFTAGKIHFTDLTGDVRNDGVIAADNQIALMGANVVNTGSLNALHGMAMMVSGPDVYVGARNGNIFVQANGKAIKAASAAAGASAASAGSVTNSGTVAAPRVLLGAGDLYSTAIVNSGLLQARSIAVNAGKNGSVAVGGTLDATSAHNPTAAGVGGSIDVLGGTVALRGATLDASGVNGGGSVRVGGDFHGGGTLATSTTTTVDAASTIRADATGSTGNGGTVVLWSDQSTFFGGSISARGGSAGGNGGSAEVSSHDALAYRGLTDLGAPAGFRGTLLLDPDNIVVDNVATGVTLLPIVTPPGTVMVGFADGTGTETISTTNLDATLATNNVVLQANNDIVVRASVAPTGGVGASNLTLDAGRDIYIGDPGTNPLGLGTAPAATTATVALGGNFTAVFNALGANTGTRTTGAAAFRMTAGSGITAPGGVSITGGMFVNGSTVAANTGGITIGGITTQGGNLTADNHLSATQGLLVNGALDSSATAANGAGGNITLATANGLTLNSTINAGGMGTGNGGTVLLTTPAGDFLANATTDTIASNSAGTGNGGAITITATAGNLTADGAINAGSSGTTGGGTGNGGTVALTAGNGTLTAGTVTTASAGTGTATAGTGTGGNVTLAATGLLTVGAIDASANAAAVNSSNAGSGGTVMMTSTGGGIAAGTVSTLSGDKGTNAAGGGVTLNAGGALGTGTINTAASGSGAGGAVRLTSTGNLTPGAITTTSASGSGGNVLLTINPGTTASTLTLPTLSTAGGGAVSGAIEADNNDLTAGSTLVLAGALNTTGTGTNTAGGAVKLTNLGGDLNLGTDTITTTGAGTGAGGNVTLTTNGTLTVNGAINATSPSGTGGTISLNDGTALSLGTTVSGGSLTTGAGTATFNNGSAVMTSGGGQTYGGPVVLNQTAVGKLTTLADTGTGTINITFDSTVDSSSANPGQSLAVNTVGGNEVFDGAVGAINPLANLTTDGNLAAGVVGTGSTQFRMPLPTTGTTANPLGGVNLTGALTVHDGVIFGTTSAASETAPTVLTGGAQSYAGAALVVSGTYLTSGSTLALAVVNGSGAPALTLNTAGAITLGGAVGGTIASSALGSLTTVGGQTVNLNGGSVQTSGALGQSYGGPVLLGANTTLTATNNGPVTFTSTVDNADTLTIATGGLTTFQNNVGGTTALTSLSVSGTGGESFTPIAASGLTSLEVKTTGLQDYTGALTLGANLTLNSSGNGAVTFGSTVNGTFALTSSTGGLTTLGNTVGSIANALTSLTVTNAAQINAATVTTSGSQTYGSLTLGGTAGAATTLTSTAATGATQINTGVVTGNSHPLTINEVSPGGTATLGAVTGAGTLTLNVNGTATVASVNDTAPVNFTGSTVDFTGTVAASNVGITASTLATFGNTLTASGTVTSNGAGSTVFDGAVSASSLSVSGGTGVTLAGGNAAGNTVTTSAGQTYGETLTLAGNTTLADTNKGTITLGAVNSDATARALTTSTGGSTIFNGVVGGTPLASLTVGLAGASNLGGTAQINTANVTTSGSVGQVYNDKVTLGASPTLTAVTGPVTFGQTLQSATTPEALTISTTGTTTFGGLVGGAAATTTAPALASLSILGGGPVNLNGGGVTTVTTSGGTQSYGTGAVTLGANTTLTGYNATFTGGITETTPGTYSLTLDFTSQVTLPGTGLLTNVGDFTSEGTGGVLITNSISTYGSQTYSGGAVTIATLAPVNLTLQAGTGNTSGSINLNAPVDELLTVPLHNLTLTAGSAGGVTIGAAIGGTHPLLSLTATTRTGGTVEPVTINGVGVTTTGAQSYGTLTLGGTGTTVLKSTGSAGSIASGAVTGGGHALTVSSAGTSNFAAISDAGGAVDFEAAGVATFTGTISASSFGLGVTTPGTRGTFSGGGNTVTTTLGQTYNEPIQLAADTTLADTADGAISLLSITTDGTPRALTTSTGGTTTFGGAVGTSAAPLASLTAGLAAPNNLGGTTQLNGANVFTNGAQTYNDTVTLGAVGAATTLTAGTGAVTFARALSSAGTTTPQALTISTSGVTTFGGIVGGTPGAVTTGVTTAPALASLTTMGGGAVDIDGGSVTTVSGSTGTQTYGGPIVLGANTLLQGYSATLNGAITSTGTGAPFNLTLDFFSQTILPGAGTFTGVRDLLVEGPGGVTLSGNLTTAGSQTFKNGLVTLTGNTTLTAGNTVATGSIELDSNVVDATPGTHSLTLVTGTAGGVTINAPVGTAVNGTGAALASLTATTRTTGGSTPTLDEPVTINATSVTTNGSQNYGSLILGGAGLTTLTSTVATGAAGINSGAVTGNGDPLTINVASTGGGSTFGPITGAGALTLNLGGTSTFGTITDTAPVNYTGGTVNFSGLGATTVTVAASGAANFNGMVGATGAFVSDGTGTTAFNGSVSADSLRVSGGTAVTINAGTITTVNGQTYGEQVFLASNTRLTDATGINLLSVDSAPPVPPATSSTPEALTVSAPTTVFGGPVGGTYALASLTTDGTSAQINGGGVTTTGAQTYNTAVTLGAPTTLTAGTGAVTFAQTLGSSATPVPLTINTSGLTSFDGQVGGAPGALASLTTLGGGTVDINGGGVTTVTTDNAAGTGLQSYSGQVVLSANAELKGNALTLAAAGLNGAGFNLTLDFVTQVTLPGAITNVGAFSTVGAGGALIDGSFTTAGTQTYSGGNVTLAGTPVLTSTAGSLIFNTPVDGAAPLTLDATGTGGQVVFNAAAQVGNTTAIGLLTSNTAAGTIFGMDATSQGGVDAAGVVTTGPVTFAEAGATSALPDVLTTGAQTYGTGAVTLGRDTFLTSTGTGAISFGTSAATAATVDSAAGTAHSLTLNTSGTQNFYGLVGSATALGGLTTGPGTTVFAMTIPTANPALVAAGVRVNGAVTTGGPAVFNVAGSNLTQPSVLTLGSGAQTYGTLTTPPGTAVTLLGAVTVLNSANTQPTPGTFNGGGTITFNGNIVAGIANPEFDVRAGVGTAEFDGSINTTGDFAPGGASVLFKGNVGTAANPVGTFTVQPNNGGTGTAGLDLNGGTYITGGSQSYLPATVISANTVLQAGGNVTFGSTLNGNNPLSPYSLTVSVNGGTIAFDGVVGGIVPLLSLTTGNVGTAVGTTQFSMALPLAATGLGGVNVLDAVTINTNADFETAGAVGVTGPTILSGVTFNGMTGTGTQTYGASPTSGTFVNLSQNTILQDLASGSITFNGKINATSNGGAFLSVNTGGDEVFNQLVGNTDALSSLTTDELGAVGGAARFNMDLTQTGATAGVRTTGTVNINDRAVFNAIGGTTLPTVLSGGAQSYALAATVRQNTVLTATAGDVVFDGTVDSGATASALTVNTPNDEVFNGAVGSLAPLVSLTTDDPTVLTPSGHVVFAFAGTAAVPSVTTLGTQTYNDAAILRAGTVLTSTGGSLVFNATVDSASTATPQNLVTNTPAVGSLVTFAQTVGGAAPLSSLTTNGQGTTQLNGGITANPATVTTTGAQEYLQAVTLGSDARLDAGTNVGFASSLDGTHNLTVDAGGASFAAVGNASPLLSLTVNAVGTTFDYTPALVPAGNAAVNLVGALAVHGPVTFDAAGVGNVAFVRTGVTVVGATATSAQDYFGPFTLAGSATFTDLKNGNLTFHQTVDGSGTANLTASTGGTIAFDGLVGAGTALTSLTTSNLGVSTGATQLNGGGVTTTGAQTYQDAVTLGAGTVLTSLAAGDIAFALTVDSLAAATAQALTVNTAGRTIFSGAVGLINALASVTTDAPGTTQLNGGSVTTTGAQTYHDPATLGANTTLVSTAGGDIAFARTLDSATPTAAENLLVNTAGRTVFGGAVGAANALASVTTDAPGTTQINGGSVTTLGIQTYNDAVTLGANTTLTSTGSGGLTFNGTLDGAFALTLNTSGLTLFNQAVGNAAPLASLTTDSAGTTRFDMPVGPLAGVVVSGQVTINDAVVFAATGASLTQPTVLTVGDGTQTYNGPVSLGTNTFLVSAAGGAPFTGGGAVLFNSAQGIASTGGSDLFVRAGVGVATVNSPINANTVDLGGAAVTFAGPVDLPGTVSVEPNDSTGGGSILFGGGTITTVGAQVYNVPFVLGNNAVLTSTGGGSITFNAALNGAFALVLDSTGDEVFNGQIGGTTPLASLTTDDPTRVQPGGHVIFGFAGTTASPSVTTSGAQTYNDAATLRADTTLASTGGSVTFASTVNGAQALTVNAAGDEIFDGRVGGSTPLASLTTDDAAGTVSGGRVVFNIAGSTTAAPGVTTTGAQTFNDAAFLMTDTVLASTGGGALTFNSTVDGAQALTLNTAGNEVFNGAVGHATALTSLVTDDPAAGTPGGFVVFNVTGTTPSVTTTGAQTFNDAVTLRADTTLTSTGGGAVTFVSTVDGAGALTVNTVGVTTFDAPVGSATALASLTTGTGAVVLDGGTVTTSGLQTFGGAVTLGADTILTSNAAGGGITFLSTVDSAASPRALTLNAVGDETFEGRVGGSNPLNSVVTNATGTGGRVIFDIVNGSSTAVPGVTTLLAQTYNNAALLQTATVLASTNGGTITFGSTVDGAQALTLNTAGNEVFDGRVGGQTALVSLTTDDATGTLHGGQVIFNVGGSTPGTPSVVTSGAQTYNDALVMLANTALTSTGKGTLTFGSTVDGGFALSVNSQGDEVFDGRVGTLAAPLASLTTDAGAASRGGHVVFNFAGTDDAPSVVTSGAQTYNDNATLRAVNSTGSANTGTIVLTSTSGGTLAFGGTVDSNDPNADNARSLTLNSAGNEIFGGAVGATHPLASLLTDDDTRYRGGDVTFGLSGASVPLSVTTTGVQTYRDAVLLQTAAVLTSTQNLALTFHSTINGAAAGGTSDLTLVTGGQTTFDGAIGNANPLSSLTVAGNGAVALDAGTVTTSGAQTYTGAVALGLDAALTSTRGNIGFDTTLDGNQNLTVASPLGTTTFVGAVGARTPLNTLTAANGSAVVIDGGSVTTDAIQVYGGAVTINGSGGTILTANDPLNTTNGKMSGNVIFRRAVDAVGGGSLLVQARRILADSDIDVAGGGNLDLEASSLLVLAGGNYVSDAGAVRLNASVAAPSNGSQTSPTIIIANSGATTRFRGRTFAMGYLQNLFAQGSVSITATGSAAEGGVLLSDMAAVGSLNVSSPVINLFAREGDAARGGTDDGLNFVAGNSINFGQSPIFYNNANSHNDVANFVTSSGLVTVNRNQQNGVSILQDQTLLASLATTSNDISRDFAVDPQSDGIPAVDTTDLSGSFSDLVQPTSSGNETIDTAAALSGALPDQKPLDVASDIPVTAGQLEELLKLGIHPRKAQRQERISLASKRALFAQLVDGLDTDNYGRLQPIKGGISTLVPSDYVVVVDRMSEHEVQDILTAFEDLYGKNKEKVPPIGEAFNTAFTDYATEKQTADPAGFAPFIVSKPGKYPAVDKAVRGFDNLFGYIEHLGLTDKEQAKAKEHIASDLEVSGVSAEDMVKVIDTLRTKIPKDQKAPSTKLPPSAPVGNPAPGATSPAQPEQKKGTPPLKTARQSSPDSPRKIARHAKPVTPDRVHALAGL